MIHGDNSARRVRPGAGRCDRAPSDWLRPARSPIRIEPRALASAALIGWGNFVFRHRNLLFPLVLAGLCAAFRPQYPLGSERLDHWLDGLGVALALAGQSLRAMASGYARVMRSGKDRRVHAERLVTDGLYRYLRNPLYAGNLLIVLGLLVIHNNPWVYAIGVPFFLLAYNAIVRAEETYLRGRFGAEYDAYCRRVGRWLPRLRNREQPALGLPFSWRRVVRQEHGTAYAWGLTALLLLGNDTLVYFSYEERTVYLNGLAALLACATGCWAMVRGLKRSGRLND